MFLNTRLIYQRSCIRQTNNQNRKDNSQSNSHKAFIMQSKCAGSTIEQEHQRATIFTLLHLSGVKKRAFNWSQQNVHFHLPTQQKYKKKADANWLKQCNQPRIKGTMGQLHREQPILWFCWWLQMSLLWRNLVSLLCFRKPFLLKRESA